MELPPVAPRLCNRSGCLEIGRYVVGLTLRAGYGTVPAKAWSELRCCAQHKDTLTVEDFVTDAGWQTICEAFAANGKARPNRALTELAFMELE